jgi:5'-3' exonuclease
MRLLLIDGHYYAYRSFFAIQGLTNSRGEPTNAVFGFVKALRKMLSDLQPDAAAVVWDAGLPERRMELLPSYKQQREETPEQLAVQFPVIEQAVAALGVTNVRIEGHEADDLIASYAAEARRLGVGEVVIATNDKDIYAIVRAGVSIYSTNKTDHGGTPEGFVLLGPHEVEAKWGVPPEKIPDVLALTGDAADNIPGVAGVGLKTAAKLVREHGGVTALTSNPEIVKNDKFRAKIAASIERLRDNMELVRLDEHLPLPLTIDALVIKPDPSAMVDLARHCEFRSLLAEFEAIAANASAPLQGELF